VVLFEEAVPGRWLSPGPRSTPAHKPVGRDRHFKLVVLTDLQESQILPMSKPEVTVLAQDALPKEDCVAHHTSRRAASPEPPNPRIGARSARVPRSILVAHRRPMRFLEPAGYSPTHNGDFRWSV
jgi:hypothetical protein